MYDESIWQLANDSERAEYEHWLESLERKEMDLSGYGKSDSKYLKAADLKGHEVPVTIAGVEEAKFDDGPKLVLKFEGKAKGMVLNKTNLKRIGSKYGYQSEDWNGKGIVLYEEEVDFQGQMVPAIRVRIPAPVADPMDEIPF